jgi:hypothetical protein
MAENPKLVFSLLDLPFHTRIHKFGDYIMELWPGKEPENHGWPCHRVLIFFERR